LRPELPFDRITASMTKKTHRKQKTAVEPANHAEGSPVAPSETNPKFFGSSLWVSIGLIAITVFVYAPVGHYSFVLYDDLQYVAKNANIQGAPLWQSIKWAFSLNQGLPLTWLSHILDVQLFGSNPGPQHITNVVFHVIDSLLLFGVLLRMTAKWKPAAFVAALFAVHPLHVESVAWIAERRDVLSTFFLLLTIWAYISYTRQPRLHRYLLMFFFFVLGLLSKPMLVTLPVLLLLLDIWPLHRLQLERGQGGRWLRLGLEKLPMLAVAIVGGIVTIVKTQNRGGIESFDSIPLSLRTANAAVSYVVYIRDMVWPVNLAAFYPYGLLPAWEVTGSVLVLIAISAFAAWNARRHSYLLVGWLWYLVTLGPVIGLIQAGGQARADRFTYVPLVGLFIIAAWGIPELTGRWQYRRAALTAAAGIVICGCAIAARRQVQYWENAYTLWQHALDTTTGNFLAHMVLGVALASDGRIDESIAQYREALAIQPGFAEAHNDLGIALARQGRIDEAILEFQAAVSLAPEAAVTHYDLGFALAEQGKPQEAIIHYSEAVRLDPSYVEAFTKLGDAQLVQGRLGEAIANYTEALRIQPNFVDAIDNLGLALAHQGKFEEAIARYNEALRLRPDFAEAHTNMGSTLANEGRNDEAIAQFTEALRIQPGNALARENLEIVTQKIQGKTK
jgi:tetratricopeptide (TPR) repeat protein